MLRARSVAVVGASARPGSVGAETLRQLVEGGFSGRVYPVNPGHAELMGLECHAGLDAVGEPVDLAVLAIGNAKLEAETERALAAGARSLAIFASCHGVATDGGPLRDRIATLATDAGASICGGNGMGFVNVEDRLRVCGFFQPPALEPGGIGFLTHSGSLFSALLHNRRGLRFNLAVSTGLELTTPMSHYLDWLLDLDSTRVIALFLETIRDPEGFAAALRRAEDRDVAVVALKVGSSSRGQAAVATHSEAIAGDDAVYEALFEAHGVHRVSTMDEMTDTIELMAAGRRAGPGGLGAVHDSGGERALLIDTAERLGVALPDLTEPTVSTLTGLLDPGLEPSNPVDAWGTGRDADQVFSSCIAALAGDPRISVVAFSVDLTAEEDPRAAYSTAVVDAATRTDKPVAVLANVAATVDPAQAAVIRAGGVPVLEGTETGLRAIGHLLARADRATWPAPSSRLTTPFPGLAAGSETEILAHYGIPTARTAMAANFDQALAAAADIGFPVVMKTTSSDHKTDLGGVALGLAHPAAVGAAYEDLAHRLGPDVSISEQVSPGVELALGMVTDPQFGPVTLLSAGGALIELLDDKVALLPPVDTAAALRAIERLRIARLLRGYRGASPSDVVGFAEVVARFSELALDARGVLVSIDLNPVIVGPGGAVVVDVLMKGH